MNALSNFLIQQIVRFGPHQAIQHRPRYRSLRWTYADLGLRVQSLTSALARQEVESGDRVLLFAKN